MWSDETEFADPVLERKRRVAQCAILLANARRWKEQHGNEAMFKSYMQYFNHRREHWGLTWDEVAAGCQEGDVAWAMAEQLGGHDEHTK